MSNGSNVVRRPRRPCRQCGGVYFMTAIGCLPALFALFGFALTAGGVYIAALGGSMDLQSGPHLNRAGIPIAVSGVVLLLLTAVFGTYHRCVKCDRRQ